MAGSASVDMDDDVQKMAIERQLRQSKDPQPVYLPQHIRGSVERAAAERASEDEAAAAEAPAEEAAPAPVAQAASPASKDALGLRRGSVCGCVRTENGNAGSCVYWSGESMSAGCMCGGAGFQGELRLLLMRQLRQ